MKDTRKPSYDEIIGEAWAGAADTPAAVSALRSILRDDPLAAEIVRTKWEDRIIGLAVAEARKSCRAQAWHGSAGGQSSREDHINGASGRSSDNRAWSRLAVETRLLLDMPLPSGLRLRAATRDEIAEAAALYRQQEAAAGWRARFLEAVAARLADGERTEDRLSEEGLRAIQEDQQ